MSTGAILSDAEARDLFSWVRPRATTCALGSREKEAAVQAVHQAAALAPSLGEAARFVRAALCRASRDASWCVIAARSLYVRGKTKERSAATFAVPALAAALASLPTSGGVRAAAAAAAAARGGGSGAARSPLPFSLLIFRPGSDDSEGGGVAAAAAATAAASMPPPLLLEPLGAAVVRIEGAAASATPPSGRTLLHIIGGLQRRVTGLDASSEGAFCAALRAELSRRSGPASTWHVVLAQACHESASVTKGAVPAADDAIASIARSPAHEASFAVCFDDSPAPLVPAVAGHVSAGSVVDEDVRYLELTLRSCAPPLALPPTEDIAASKSTGTAVEDAAVPRDVAATAVAKTSTAALAPGTPSFYHLALFRTSRTYVSALARDEDEDWLDAVPALRAVFADGGGRAPPPRQHRLRRRDAAVTAEGAAEAAAAAFRRRYNPCAWVRDFRAVDSALANFRLGAWVFSGVCLLLYVVLFSAPAVAPVLALAAGSACAGVPPLPAALLSCAARGREAPALGALASLAAWALPPQLAAMSGARHALPADVAALLPVLWPAAAPPPLAACPSSRDAPATPWGTPADQGIAGCSRSDELLAELHAGQKTSLAYAALAAFFCAAATTWMRKRAFQSWITAVLKGVAADMRHNREGQAMPASR